MKRSLKTFLRKTKVGVYTLLVYGERWEDGKIDGIYVTRVKYSRDGQKVLTVNNEPQHILLERPYTRTRYFNMGWAICSPQDTYDEKTGIELCKKRFRKSPLTAKTGLFLTNDMVNAILDNEVNYIKAHWGKFVPFEIILDDEPGTDKEVAETEPEKEVTEPTQAATEETLVNDKTETPETEATFNEGTFVTFKSDKENGVTTVGCIKKIKENKNLLFPEKIYFHWIAQFDKDYFNFKYDFGADTLSTDFDNVRLSTSEEVLAAVNAIKKNTGVIWNAETREFKKVK